MIDADIWTKDFLRLLRETFGGRIWFAGLQGSYGRGEADEASDLDLVVILDELSAADIQTYGNMLDRLPNRALACGFLSGRDELLHWEASELFQFYYDTRPLLGSLDGLLAQIDEAAVDRAIKAGACTIYHGCVHNMLYEKSGEILRALYQSACFVVQAICFRQTGRYVKRHTDLLGAAAAGEREIVETHLALRAGGAVALEAMSEALFLWAQGWIRRQAGELPLQGRQG